MKRLFCGLIVLALLLSALPALAAGQVVRTTSKVNLRSGPGLDYAILTDIAAGRELPYLGSTQIDERGVAWYYVQSASYDGWVSSVYTTLTGD